MSSQKISSFSPYKLRPITLIVLINFIRTISQASFDFSLLTPTFTSAVSVTINEFVVSSALNLPTPRSVFQKFLSSLSDSKIYFIFGTLSLLLIFIKILSCFIKVPEGRVKSSIVYKAISFKFNVYSTLKILIYGPAYKNEEGRLSFKGKVNGTLIFLEPSTI